MAEDGSGDERLTRRLARERAARQAAEAIAERATRELYEAVQRAERAASTAELLGVIAASANESTGPDHALRVALDAICAHTGSPVGHALTLAPESDDTLVSTGIWHFDNAQRFAGFRLESERQTFESGVGLPGRVLASGESAWITSVPDDANFPRASVARRAGLGAAFAFPVVARYEVKAVLEFFFTDLLEPDEALLRVATQIGAQLGRVYERRDADTRLRRQALYDSLTGLANRSLLIDRIQHALRRSHRNATSVVVLFLDLDDFKTINDSLGHTVGDAVLTAVAERLTGCLRVSDTVGRPELVETTVARVGGDEFAIVLEDCDDAEVVARRLLESFDEALSIDGSEVFARISIGAASTTQGLSEAALLLSSANVALHVAKRAGKNRLELYDASMRLAVSRRHELGTDLRRAVDEDQLRLHYQPCVSLVTGEVISVEALLRWQLGDELVPPNEFIPLAEETGLIVPIGNWVIERACAEIHRLQSTHAPDITVSVNVSGRQLLDPALVDHVAASLEGCGLEPHRLTLEVTESVLMENRAAAISTLVGLRELGVELAIDDFGTGYSSLAQLRDLPIQYLKVDRSFISALPADDDAGTIAWAVIRLGHNLGLRVVAEGVETREQLDALRRYGCDAVQGFLFARGVEFDALRRTIERLATA